MPDSIFSPHLFAQPRINGEKFIDDALNDLEFQISEIQEEVLDAVGLDFFNLKKLGLDYDYIDDDIDSWDSTALESIGPFFKGVIRDAQQQIKELVKKKFTGIAIKLESAFILGRTSAASLLAKLYLGELREDFVGEGDLKSIAKSWLVKGLVLRDRDCIARVANAAARYQSEEKKKDVSLQKNDVIEILEQAFEKGYTDAAYQLGKLYFSESDFTSARSWFEKGFALGDEWCQLGLLECHEKRGLRR